LWNRVRADTAKLMNIIIAGFKERRNLVRKGEMFIKDEAKVVSKAGGVE